MLCRKLVLNSHHSSQKEKAAFNAPLHPGSTRLSIGAQYNNILVFEAPSTYKAEIKGTNCHRQTFRAPWRERLASSLQVFGSTRETTDQHRQSNENLSAQTDALSYATHLHNEILKGDRSCSQEAQRFGLGSIARKRTTSALRTVTIAAMLGYGMYAG
jgi:hypothetical protein